MFHTMKPQDIAIFILGTTLVYSLNGSFKYTQDVDENITPELVAEFARDMMKAYGIPLKSLRVFEYHDNEMKLRIKI